MSATGARLVLDSTAVALMYKVFRGLPGLEADGARYALGMVLELEDSTTSSFPRSDEAAKPEVASEPTAEQKRIAKLEEMVTATRARAEAAEMEILRLKRG